MDVCYVMLCYVMSCHVMLCHVMLCYVMDGWMDGCVCVCICMYMCIYIYIYIYVRFVRFVCSLAGIKPEGIGSMHTLNTPSLTDA